MNHYLKLTDLSLHNQRVLIREDFNVPMKNGVITDDTRIRSALPTIKYALLNNARVIILSHCGRPVEGEFNAEFSLKGVAEKLSQLLNQSVAFQSDWINGVSVAPGQVVLCENVRFLQGEKSCEDQLSKKLGNLCDIFVMDAFATAHRAEASTVGVAKYAPIACAGLLLDAELTALSRALSHPKKPFVAIVGGSKISTKMHVLDSLLDQVDTLIVGGGIANTFLCANNSAVGNSLIEKDWINAAKKLLEKAKLNNVHIPLPIDVAVAKIFSENAVAEIKSLRDIKNDDMILDVGPKTAASYTAIMQAAKTIVWNGPVGVFEFPAFAAGTKALALAIAESDAYSIAGGGDTLSAVATFGVQDKIAYLSTGGGAFLELMEGKTLPAVEILQARV